MINKLKAVYLQVAAGVRHWEDAEVNGVPDADGKLIPFRAGDNWCPVIRLENGQVMSWPDVRADVHYKVCDAGEYWLLDEHRNRIAKWGGYYVPADFLCVDAQGYGDYIIMTIASDGKIEGWEKPEIVYGFPDDEDDGFYGWVPVLPPPAAATAPNDGDSDVELHPIQIAQLKAESEEQKRLLRECRFALDGLIEKKPSMAGLLCGSNTLGNLRAELYKYRMEA